MVFLIGVATGAFIGMVTIAFLVSIQYEKLAMKYQHLSNQVETGLKPVSTEPHIC